MSKQNHAAFGLRHLAVLSLVNFSLLKELTTSWDTRGDHKSRTLCQIGFISSNCSWQEAPSTRKASVSTDLLNLTHHGSLLPGGHHSEGHPTRGSSWLQVCLRCPWAGGEHHMAQDAHADSILGQDFFCWDKPPLLLTDGQVWI